MLYSFIEERAARAARPSMGLAVAALSLAACQTPPRTANVEVPESLPSVIVLSREAPAPAAGGKSAPGSAVAAAPEPVSTSVAVSVPGAGAGTADADTIAGLISTDRPAPAAVTPTRAAIRRTKGLDPEALIGAPVAKLDAIFGRPAFERAEGANAFRRYDIGDCRIYAVTGANAGAIASVEVGHALAGATPLSFQTCAAMAASLKS